ncbi:MAG TPA: hypothetical protein ENH62_02295 [Marinobacter sp.]|uniref:Uncharacterized protein n=1 Tax=marine sediment metagenome TaxID=412755 RepID=A0A0F9LYD5_9ZZZZ|nr:hypothetical protein [Marinobacter sp.]
MPSVTPSPRRKSDKQFRDQLILAGNELTVKGTRKLRAVANRMMDDAIAGVTAAQTAIRDTYDGKPAQALTVEAHVEHQHSLLDEAEVNRRLASMLYQADRGLIEGPLIDITPAST